MSWKNADRESRAGEETRRFMLTKKGSIKIKRNEGEKEKIG